jgi:hypothetical protein
MSKEEIEKQRVLKTLKSDYGWDLELLDDETKQTCEALLHYAIKAIKSELINTPEINDFVSGVKAEAAHQTDKWGVDHEENKYPHDYALVIDKLKGKQALAIWDKDIEKYKHHLITMAAASFNAHRQISKDGTNMNKHFTT